MTQCDKIVAFMREHGEITQRDAIGFGCYRLGARIWDLKAAGMDIKREMRQVKNADGSRTMIAVYRMAA